jgi:hypothetical protein
MKRAVLSAALAVVFMAGMSAQGKPSFAGKWKADSSYNLWTITVDGSKMTLTTTVAGNTSEPTVYMLDGTPSTATMEGPNGQIKTVYTSTWEGDVLVTTIEAPMMTRIERRSIEADGTMKVQTTITMMQGKPAPPGGPPPLVLKRVG